MYTSEEWAGELQRNLFEEGSHIPHDQSNETDAGRFGDIVKKIPVGSPDWNNAFQTAIQMIERDSWESSGSWLTFQNYFLLLLMKSAEATSKLVLVKMLTERELPSDCTSRVFFLRHLVAEQGVKIDWDNFCESGNYKRMESESPLLVADTLVFAMELQRCERIVHSALESGCVEPRGIHEILKRWEQRPRNHNREEEFRQFLRNIRNLSCLT